MSTKPMITNPSSPLKPHVWTWATVDSIFKRFHLRLEIWSCRASSLQLSHSSPCGAQRKDHAQPTRFGYCHHQAYALNPPGLKIHFKPCSSENNIFQYNVILIISLWRSANGSDFAYEDLWLDLSGVLTDLDRDPTLLLTDSRLNLKNLRPAMIEVNHVRTELRHMTCLQLLKTRLDSLETSLYQLRT